jgi:hypothetical protein
MHLREFAYSQSKKLILEVSKLHDINKMIYKLY